MDEIKKILQLIADKTITPEDAVTIVERWKSQGRDVRLDSSLLNPKKKKEEEEPVLAPVEIKVDESFSKKDRRNIEEILAEEAISVMASFLKMEPDQVSLKTSLQNYGMDSVTAANITNHFASKYQIPLAATLLIEVRNLDEYTQLLLNQFRDKIADYYREPEGSEASEDKRYMNHVNEEVSVEGEPLDLDAMWADASKKT